MPKWSQPKADSCPLRQAEQMAEILLTEPLRLPLRERFRMARIWDDHDEIQPEQLAELMERMGLNQQEMAEVLEVTYGHFNNLLRGRRPVQPGPTRVLVRWLFDVYGVAGGRPAHPMIPRTRVPLRAAV